MEKYYACFWYPYFVEHNIPTIKSIILKARQLEALESEINTFIKKYPFVRLCNASPKDYKKDCIFSNFFEVKEALENSNRTWYMLTKEHGIHLLMRKYVAIVLEARCFIYNSKLTAVSCDYYCTKEEKKTIKESILEFFDVYLHKIPYDTVTIDIGMNKEQDLFIIECNGFGPDSKASAELFDWHQDYKHLYSDTNVSFRFKKEYAW
jgi:hypothetical protein